MTSYNHDDFVADAIESVLGQTFSDFEFIITDDGSSDNTADIVASYSKKDKRIKSLFFEKNKGACVALEECFKYSQGEYIAIINSDDTWQSEKLKKQLDYLEKNNDVAAVFSRVQAIDEQGEIIESDFTDVFNRPVNRSRYEWLHHFFYNGNCLCHPSVLIRKSAYIKAGGIYKKHLASLPDMDMWVRLCLTENIYIIEEKLVSFRVLDNGGNESANTIANRKRYALEIPLILDNYLQIASVEEFRLIFPSHVQFNDASLIHYHIARCAINCSTPWHKLFGIQLLYKIFIDDAEMLKRASFDVTELHKLAKTYDVYNLGCLEQNYRKKYIRMKRLSFSLSILLLLSMLNYFFMNSVF